MAALARLTDPFGPLALLAALAVLGLGIVIARAVDGWQPPPRLRPIWNGVTVVGALLVTLAFLAVVVLSAGFGGD